MKTDITSIGEILIDLTQTGFDANGIPQFAANPGGAPANAAVAAARLGASAAFIGRVGADGFGEYLRTVLLQDGIHVENLSVDSAVHTTLAVVSVDASGERSFSFYRNPGADLMLNKNDIPDEPLRSTKILHFGSVSLTADPSRTATLDAVKRAKEFGAVISYDPNYRPALWNSEVEAVKQMRAPLDMVDILKISDEELQLVTGETELEKGAEKMQQKGIRLVLITLGAKGVFYRYNDLQGQVAGVPVKVADTNGAGDTFFGAVLAKLSQLNCPDTLSKPELEDILAFANQAAAITTSRHGAIPAMPYQKELR